MPEGIVKWFDAKKGFGFINYKEGSDVFVHYSNIVADGFRCLKKGELVEYDLAEGPKGLQAEKVRRKSLISSFDPFGSQNE